MTYKITCIKCNKTSSYSTHKAETVLAKNEKFYSWDCKNCGEEIKGWFYIKNSA